MLNDPSTAYYTDFSSGRHSLVALYTAPQVGTEYSKYLFTFKCFTSCVGGLNRRKIQLVDTRQQEWEYPWTSGVGCHGVCACPGRDWKTEEKAFEMSKAPQKKPLERLEQSDISGGALHLSQRRRKKDKETFYILVQGCEKYELFRKIKESLDLMDYVEPSQISQYRQQQAQQQMQLNQHICDELQRYYRKKESKKLSGNEKQKWHTSLSHI
ncbi:tumor protein p73-like [Diadema antillarum]|uniref:tumor protein p73-like n=1 Tax=Diadema antillarum TaxID=105358 RepID=UPI003A83BD3A